MKNMLFLINTLGDGGAERALVDMVNHLDLTNFHVTVQTILDEGCRKADLSSAITYKTIIRSRCKLLRKLEMALLVKIIPARIVYKLFIKSYYDIEVAFLEGLPTKLIAASDALICRKVAWVHTDLIKYFDSASVFKSQQECKKAYEKFNEIVGVSEDVVKQFRARFSWEVDNTFVLYNVNDDEKIRTLSNEYVPCIKREGSVTFLACGRLVAQKGFDRLLRIQKRLIVNGYKCYLKIVGEGSERLMLETAIKENNLTEFVELHGFCNNPYPYFINADVLVCSSLTEGYSTVVTEAVILGLPIISVDVAGAAEPHDCPRCNVVCKNNEESLYLAIKHVLDNPYLLVNYREEQKQKSSYFSTKNQIKRIEKFFLNDKLI